MGINPYNKKKVKKPILVNKVVKWWERINEYKVVNKVNWLVLGVLITLFIYLKSIQNREEEKIHVNKVIKRWEKNAIFNTLHSKKLQNYEKLFFPRKRFFYENPWEIFILVNIYENKVVKLRERKKSEFYQRRKP